MGPLPHAVVGLLLETGLRVAEVVDLRWEQISLRERSGWVDVVGKRGEHRRVPLNAAARDVLVAIRPGHDHPSGPVFNGKRGPYTPTAACAICSRTSAPAPGSSTFTRTASAMTPPAA